MVNYPHLAAVADSFSRAATSYDAAAVLQNDVADALLNRTKAVGTVLDLGCGTGRNTQRLLDQQTVHEVIGLDIAAGMLAFAKQRVRSDKPISWIQANAKALPFVDGYFDCIYSSLALQWLGADSDLFREIARVMKPGASAVVSTLLPGTLAELQEAWRSVDDSVHINEFEAASAWLGAIETAGLTVKHEQQLYCRYFDTAMASMKELKALGARNLNQGRTLGLTGKHRLRQFEKAYELHRQPQGLPATYKLLLLEITKPI